MFVVKYKLTTWNLKTHDFYFFYFRFYEWICVNGFFYILINATVCIGSYNNCYFMIYGVKKIKLESNTY